MLGIRRKGSPLVCLFRLTRLNSHEEGRDKQDAGNSPRNTALTPLRGSMERRPAKEDVVDWVKYL